MIQVDKKITFLRQVTAILVIVLHQLFGETFSRFSGGQQ